MRKALAVLVVAFSLVPVTVFGLPPCPPPDIQARVVEVVDGDTIKVELTNVPEDLAAELTEGSVVTIRYIGVDAPEMQTSEGPAAKALNALLVEDRIVFLELDETHWDRYGRLLAYVYLDAGGNLMVNLVLISTPIIGTKAYAGTERYANVFEEADLLPAPQGCGGGPEPPFIEITSLTSPVSRGSYATLCIRTVPGARCTITVYYKSGPSSAAGLEPKIADSEGRVCWSWKVGSRTTPGSWRIVVTATNALGTATETTYFTVQY